jgi:hypothetical protein
MSYSKSSLVVEVRCRRFRSEIYATATQVSGCGGGAGCGANKTYLVAGSDLVLLAAALAAVSLGFAGLGGHRRGRRSLFDLRPHLVEGVGQQLGEVHPRRVWRVDVERVEFLVANLLVELEEPLDEGEAVHVSTLREVDDGDQQEELLARQHRRSL